MILLTIISAGFLTGCSETEKDTGEEQEQQAEPFAPTAGDWDLLASPGENDCEFTGDEPSVAVLTTTDGGFTFLVDKEATEDDPVPTFTCTLSDMSFTCEQYSMQDSQGGSTLTQVIDLSGSFTDENTMSGEANLSMSFGTQSCSGIMNLTATAIQ